MTKSTITREQITSWMNDANHTLEEPLNADDAAAARAILAMGHELLAAMDSEPVAEVVSIYGDPEAFGEREIRPLVGIQQMPYGTKLYRHAQPAPVVPDESYQQLSELYHAQEKRLFKIAQRIKGPAFDKYSHSPSQAIDVLEVAIFGDDESCRAAMLAATPQEVK